ncbi:acylphosphatase, partial [Shewanella sp.]|uniref:acylphosphatase n=1 Tax=Shewanella sp. TaxID=50422 RepID=UPI003F341D48
MDNPSSQAELQRKQLHITGIVQGVGFRPLVYRYAKECQVTGSVLNNSMGVTIEIQGHAAQVARFIEQLTTNPPPLARIDRISHQALTIEGNETDFVILHSEHDDATGAQVAVAADKSTCQDCLEDMQDPNNRHFGYAFTNCTNCGPRYTIIKALPYDRHNTAMADFAMCPECASAYQNPLDRRYHAQPVSCRHCGPTLRLTTALGERIYPASWQTSTDKQVLLLAAERLRQGHILAIKGLGGFHLVCDATNDAAVSALRQRKQRPAKPLAVMMADRAMATEYITGSAREWQVLCSQERPIVLMNRLA